MSPSVTRLRLAILTHWNGRQYDLARRCAIDRSDLARYVGGRMAMPNHHRAILAAVLGLEPSDIEGWFNGDEVWQKVAG